MTNHLKIWMFLGAFASTTLAFTSPAPAATVTPGPPSSGGINYTWTVANLSGTDTSGAIQRHVGALSFNDPLNFGDPIGTGWTHTSDWIAVDLTEPAQLTIDVSRKAGVPNGTETAGDALAPAFALYSGWHVTGGDWHVFNNSGPFAWAPELSFIGNVANGTAVGTNVTGTGLPAVSGSFILPAGHYSIELGGNPANSIGSGRQGYEAVLTTSPVPEPSALTLAGLALCMGGWLALRKQHVSA